LLIYVQKVIYGRTENPKLKFKTFQKETIKKESKSGVRQSSIIGKFAIIFCLSVIIKINCHFFFGVHLIKSTTLPITPILE